MTRSAALRSVKPGEGTSKAGVSAKTVAQAARSGTHRDLLVAMRDRIAKAVSATDCPPRDLAALSRRLQEIAKEIEALDASAAEEARDSAVSGDEDWDAEAL